MRGFLDGLAAFYVMIATASGTMLIGYELGGGAGGFVGAVAGLAVFGWLLQAQQNEVDEARVEVREAMYAERERRSDR